MNKPCFLLSVMLLPLALAIPSLARADSKPPGDLLDPTYGMALYEHFLGNSLAAMTHIEVGRQRDALAGQADEAGLFLGGLYFDYGLIDDARSLFDGLLQHSSDANLRDRVWYNLARVNYQRGQTGEVEGLLQRIDSALPRPHEDNRHFIEAALLIGEKRLDEAETALVRIDMDSPLYWYATYNLALRRLGGDDSSARPALERLASIDSSHPDLNSLADQAALTLGLQAFTASQYQSALQYLSRVRVDGPLTARALLAVGWVHQRIGDTPRAIAYWRQLLELGHNDATQREARFAIPHALQQAGLLQASAREFELAAQYYDEQSAALNGISKRVRRGELLNHLPKAGTGAAGPTPTSGSSLPAELLESLSGIIASQPFQNDLRRLRELRDIEQVLAAWQQQVPVLALMLDERSAGFERKAPEIAQSVDVEYLHQLQARRAQLATGIAAIERGDDYLALANDDERDQLAQIESSQRIIETIGDTQDLSAGAQQLRLLRGLVHYRIETDLPRRLWRARYALQQLDKQLEEANQSVQALDNAATGQRARLSELQELIDSHQQSIADSLGRTRELLRNLRQTLNERALDYLRTEQNRLSDFRLETQYALARLYDQLTSTGQDRP